MSCCHWPLQDELIVPKKQQPGKPSAGRPCRQARPAAQPALRRRTGAGGHCPGHRQQSANPPGGRADRQPGFRTSEEVMALFRELNNSGQTVVMVTHNPDNGRYADRTITLKDGAVVTT